MLERIFGRTLPGSLPRMGIFRSFGTGDLVETRALLDAGR
jgi:hypothetical protein